MSPSEAKLRAYVVAFLTFQFIPALRTPRASWLLLACFAFPVSASWLLLTFTFTFSLWLI